MKTPAEYEQDIADRDRMIEKLKKQLVKAFEVIAQQQLSS